MKSYLILCDGAQRSETGFNQEISLNCAGSKPNLKATIDELSHSLFQELDDKLEDFLRIATFVHAADGAISRGSEVDVYARKWVRNLSFIIPVHAPDFWNQNVVKDNLIECLSFLSEDRYNFDFVMKNRSIFQGMLDFNLRGLPQAPHADSILNISGGLDSLAGTIQAVKEHSLHPVLVGHWSSTKIKSRQKAVVEGLREKLDEWDFPWIGMWSHYKNWTPVERSQRCRSFLFLSLSTVCAKQAGFNIVRINDNGITSANLPHTDSTRGAFLTRSTHPKFLYLFQKLASHLPGQRVVIENTLLNNTKADVVKIIAKYGCEELIQETSSCFRIVRRTSIQQHCGTCSQCIDRRFATEIAGLSNYDIPERYEKDVFTDPLDEGDMRTNAENYVRFAREVKDMPLDSFIEKYSPIWDCVSHLPDKDVADSLKILSELHIRHSKEVWKMAIAKCQENAIRRIEGDLPDTSLVSMIFSNEIYSDLQGRYVEKLCNILSKSLPAFFQHKEAGRETDVQDAGQGCFIATQEQLHREGPMHPFAGVGTKPDFSKLIRKNDSKGWLFVEFKYPKGIRDKPRIVKEITSRILVYKDHASYPLFIVYDPNRAISDDNEFENDLEKYGAIWVRVIR